MDGTSGTTLISVIWRDLQDSAWNLQRTLESANSSEPSGTCQGTATFTARQPSMFIDKDGKFQTASKEMIYSEAGSFIMALQRKIPNPPKMQFSRQYVWRLENENLSQPQISIWFVKPDTADIDYLFHRLVIGTATTSDQEHASTVVTKLECSGGHLCVEDFYSSIYTFTLSESDNAGVSQVALDSWGMQHEVVGPKKDQIIETHFHKMLQIVEATQHRAGQ